MTVRNYSDLMAWRSAMELVTLVYAATKHFPADEMYGLRSQLRRAAVSIPSNIAEGQGRRTKAEFIHSLSVAHGSLREVETQVLISKDLGYISADDAENIREKASEVGRLITGLSHHLSN